jgi:uncharacterized membrane protein YfcA
MTTFISMCFAVAVAAFVLALPCTGTRVGRFCYRTAGVAFTLALLPALVTGLAGVTLSGRDEASILAWIGGLTLVALAAYAALAVRKRLKPGRDAWSQYVAQKSAGKQPLGDDDRPDAGLW